MSTLQKGVSETIMENPTREQETKTDARTRISFSQLKAGMVVRLLKDCSAPGYYSYYKSYMLKKGQTVYIKQRHDAMWSADHHTFNDVRYYIHYPDKDTELELLQGEALQQWEEQEHQAALKNMRLDRGYDQKMYVGLDPEIFVLNGRGHVMPAFKFLGEKPKSPKAFGDLYGGGESKGLPYWDGFQAEWNVCPTYCHAWTVDFVQYGLKAVLNAAKKKNKLARLTAASVVELRPRDFAVEDKYIEFGCMPSFNAYGVKPLAVRGRDVPLRFAGFHIHFGYAKAYPNVKKDDYPRIVRAIDRILGPIMTSLLADLEDPRRRLFYGRAGEYRLPAHGLEYRVPSSTVMCNPLVAHLVLDMARFAGWIAINKLEDWWQIDSQEQTMQIINECDVQEARHNLKRNFVALEYLIHKTYSFDDDKQKKLIELINNGVKDTIECNDMQKVWKLNETWDTHSNGTGESIANYNLP